MSGKYLKEVHACAKPFRKRTHNVGTVWQCDCGRIYVLSFHNGVYGIPSSWSWRRIPADNWDPIKLEEKPVTYTVTIPAKSKWSLFK